VGGASDQLDSGSVTVSGLLGLILGHLIMSYCMTSESKKSFLFSWALRCSYLSSSRLRLC
jgi:hypothetical protein